MADELLETAISNWGPRFTASGVDASDYARVTSQLQSWNDWCAGWSRAGDDHVALADAALGEGRTLSAGEALQRAATYYHFGKFLFVHDLDQARATHERAVDAATRGLPLLSPAGRRVDVPYGHGRLVGVLRSPQPDSPLPTVLLVPGLDSAKEEFPLVEATFHARGLATFSLDGPGQGESEWEFPIEPDWAPVGAAVLDALRSCSEVDSARIGVWGVSLGG
ncbi:MAG: alpha/beta hydrolase, partial [Acidimicrobiaceae bacterium]|nr:alpha/beta hydrolase [Acidimicrobiaceae bacterium]